MAKIKDDFTCQSPVQPDYNRVVNHDEYGNEIISYEEVDYPKVQASLGRWTDWSLDSLIKAGINPDFAIHTGNPTRLEGIDQIGAWSDAAEGIISEMENNK